MPLQRAVHSLIDIPDLPWILTDQCRSELLNASASAGCIGRKINRAERADFSVTRDLRIGQNFDDSGVEDRHRFAAGPLVLSLAQWKIDLIKIDAGDFHVCSRLVALFFFKFVLCAM